MKGFQIEFTPDERERLTIHLRRALLEEHQRFQSEDRMPEERTDLILCDHLAQAVVRLLAEGK